MSVISPHHFTKNATSKQLPVVVTRGEDGYYIVECPILPGAYTQGATVDEGLKNIREVLRLLIQEEECCSRLSFS